MKKIVLLVITLALFHIGYAQDEVFKPIAGERNLEVNFTPFGNPVIAINGIRFRKFNSETSAFRINVFAAYASSSEVTQQENGNNKQLKDSQSGLAINIRPGIEKHFAGTNRLSPYVGLEGDIALQKTTFKEQLQQNNEVETMKTIDEGGYFRIGANLVAGFDYYIAKKLYLGTEFGFGMSYKKDLAVKLKSSVSGFDEPDPQKRGGTFNLGPNVNGAIRLGYIF